MKILPDRIIWDEEDWLAGLVPQHASSVGLTVGSAGASFERNVNPFRRLGGICPGFAPTNVTGADASSVASMIVGGDTDYGDTDPHAYLGGGSLLNKLKLVSDTLSTSDFPKSVPLIGGHAAHANLDIKDVLVYNVAASTMVFYSYADNTDGDVGAFDRGLAGAATFSDAFKSDFISAVASGGTTLGTDTHPLVLGDDGAMYIGDGRTLRKFDGETGANGTLSSAFTLPRGFVIRSFAKIFNYLILFTSRAYSSAYRGNSIAWAWNYVSDRPNFTFDLADNQVTAGFIWRGIPGCFTYGRSAEGGIVSTKIKLFNGSHYEQIAALPSRNPPGHGGVEIYDDLIIWNSGTGSQSWLTSCGNPWTNKMSSYSYTLNFWGEPSGTSQSATLGGLCRNFGSAKLYASSGTSTTGGLEIFLENFGPTVASGSVWQGLTAVPLLPAGLMAKVKSVRVTFRNTASGGRDLTLALVTDFRADTTTTVISALQSVTATTMTREFRFDTTGAQLPFFTSIAPSLTWSTVGGNTDAPTVNRLEVFYESVNLLRNW